MIKPKLRKVNKCPPSWCPLKRQPGCCIACQYHVEKGKYIVFCAHKNAWKIKNTQ